MSADADGGAAGAPSNAGSIRWEIPATLSPEAARQLEAVYAVIARQAGASAGQVPASLGDWDAMNASMNAIFEPFAMRSAATLGITVEDDTLGGVPVLRIVPTEPRPRGRTYVYLHGGGYTLFSTRATLIVPSLIAAASGEEVISVDYTLAPRGTWRSVTDQVLAVWEALLQRGKSPASTGLFGDSAGGGLAAGSVLKMRDRGMRLPGALYLISPWSDLTRAGDSHATLAHADPTLTTVSLAHGAAAYAPPLDQGHPYVSPVHGDYTGAYPPTLIQFATREILVSDAIRLYQAIRGGGHVAVLDGYEGMPHVFQALAPDCPETRTSIARAVEFFDLHLESAA